MTVRTRVTLAAGLAVLLAVVAASIAVYVIVQDNLYGQVDESLRHNDPGSGPVQSHDLSHDAQVTLRHVPLVQDAFMQVVDSNGEVRTAFDDRPLPVTAEVVAVARGERGEIFFDTTVDGTPVRVYAAPAGDGTALQVGRSLAEVDQALRRLVWALVAISVAAVGLAALIGRLVAAAAVAPVHRVAEAAETVARTGELSVHIAVPGGDELGRLAASYNTMLDALSQSLGQQRQLVADASHELRTPLATVRTNVEVLARNEQLPAGDKLPPDDKATLVSDTVAQIGELTRLVDDLVELARGDGQPEPFVPVDLAGVTAEAVDAARRNHPSVTFQVDATRTLVQGSPTRLGRAVSNLIDNAAKWSPPGAEVRIAVQEGTVSVADQGPGVDPADLPYLFDRFYRSPRARAMPGSGLGLAIVRQVADSHRGTVTAAAAGGVGARFTLRLPVVDGEAGTGQRESG